MLSSFCESLTTKRCHDLGLAPKRYTAVLVSPLFTGLGDGDAGITWKSACQHE